MRRCFGLTKNLNRCGRIGNWRVFCSEHNKQWLVFIFVAVFTVGGGGASLITWLNPVNSSDEEPKLEIINQFVDYELQGIQPKRLSFTFRSGGGMEVINKSRNTFVFNASLSPEGTAIFWPDHWELKRVPGVFQISEKIIDTRNLTILPNANSKPAIEYIVSVRVPENEAGVPIPTVFVYKIEWKFKSNGKLFFDQCVRHFAFPDYLEKEVKERMGKASRKLLPCDLEGKVEKREKSSGSYSDI